MKIGENEEVVDVNFEDTFKTDFDPFDLDEIDLKQKNVKSEEAEEEQTEEQTEEKSEEKEEEETEESSEEENTNESPVLTAGIAIAKMLAEKKGVDDQIDWDAIETDEDLENILDSFDDLDVALATERLKQSDETISKIVTFLEKGGKTEEILSLLNSNKELREADITTEKGCKDLLKDYYKNVVKFSDDVIAKKIKRFEDNESLAEEAEDILPLYQEHLSKQIETKQQELDIQKEKQEVDLKQKQISFVSKLKANQYNKVVATELYNTAFSEIVLKDGTKRNLLDVKIEKIKSDPDLFLKFVSFTNNPQQYDKQILASKGSSIVQEQTKRKLLFNSKPKETVTEKSTKKQIQFKFN